MYIFIVHGAMLHKDTFTPNEQIIWPSFPTSVPCPRYHHLGSHVTHTYLISCIYINPRNHKWGKTYLSSRDWLHLFNIISSCIQFPSNGTASFFLAERIPLCVSTAALLLATDAGSL